MERTSEMVTKSLRKLLLMAAMWPLSAAFAQIPQNQHE
jgi:hypothetical protein